MDTANNDFLLDVLQELTDDEPRYLDAFVRLIDVNMDSLHVDFILRGLALELRNLVLERADQMRGQELQDRCEREMA